MDGFGALVAETVFPTRCVACGHDGAWLCTACCSAVDLVSREVCASCGSVKSGHACPRDNALDGLVAVGFYHDPRLRALIHGLKYHLGTCLLPSFEQVLHRYADERRNPWPWAGASGLSIQAVPATPRRVRERGFDQAELLRDVVRREIAPWATPCEALARTGTRAVQADLPTDALREANAHESFHIIDPVGVPSTILLIDDVFTTGATMRAAAHLLKSAGARRVFGFAFALGA